MVITQPGCLDSVHPIDPSQHNRSTHHLKRRQAFTEQRYRQHAREQRLADHRRGDHRSRQVTQCVTDRQIAADLREQRCA